MKSLARMFVWWPGIDRDIERTVRLSQKCQTSLSPPPLTPLQPWKWPNRPWSRPHIDYVGAMYGKMCLIIIDAHSKWIEAGFVPSATSAATIELLSNSFARFGLPSPVVIMHPTSSVRRSNIFSNKMASGTKPHCPIIRCQMVLWNMRYRP